MSLKEKTCIPCQGGVPSLDGETILIFKKKISADWDFTHDNTRLLRKLKFKDFKMAMDLAYKIGKMADEQWHHPELHVGFGHLEIEVWTHKINGLVESDFIFAAKADEIIEELLDS